MSPNVENYDLTFNHIIARERASGHVGKGKFPLWVTRRCANIKPNVNAAPKDSDDPQEKWSLEGTVKIKSLRDHILILSFENVRLFSNNRTNPPIGENLPVPRLSLYLTRKCPKSRMVDIEENGSLIETTIDGFLQTSHHGKPSTFDVPLCNQYTMKDIFSSVGIVVVKRKDDYPLSQVPLVVGFGSFVDHKPKKKTPQMHIEADAVDVQQELERAYLDAKSEATLKLLSHYSRLAKKAFKLMVYQSRCDSINDKLTFEDFKVALDLINVVVVESRARKLFKLAVTDNVETIDITEFEIALMINDSVPIDLNVDMISPYDAFHSFDIEENGNLNKLQFLQCAKILDVSNTKTDKELSHIFEKIAAKHRNTSVIDYDLFKKIWCYYLADVDYELNKVKIKNGSQTKPKLAMNEKIRFLISERIKSIFFRKTDDLLKAVNCRDQETNVAFILAREKTIDLRAKARQHRDAMNRSAKAEIASYNRTAIIENSAWNKEQRANKKKEQQERAKKRKEEKISKEMKRHRLQQIEQRRQMSISNNRDEREAFRIKEIQRKGEDKLVLKDLDLHHVPPRTYSNNDAVSRLSHLVYLDLSGNKLTDLPSDNFFFHMNSLRKLNLSRNRLIQLPKEISNLGNLEMLLLDSNNMTYLPIEIKYLKNLVIFNCSLNRFDTFPTELGNMVSLKVIDAHGNRLTNIPGTIGNLNELEIMDMSQNNLQILPDQFCSLNRLLQLNLSKNRLTRIPDNFGNLSCLEYVNLNHNQIHMLPDTIRQMASLKKFEIQDNTIQKFPSISSGWSNILDLNLKSNQITSLPTYISGLISIQRLFAPSNKIKNIPAEIGLLVSLQELQLQSNQIETIPIEIGALVSLQNLNLSQNTISDLPNEFCLLRSMRSLNISSNRLNMIPESIGAIKSLETIDLSCNSISRVPLSTSELVKIQSFNLSSNNLQEFPSEICKHFIELVDLNLSSNRIMFLPSEFAHLKSLQKVDLHHNNLRALPLEFVQVAQRLSFIDLRQNPFDLLPFKWNSQWSRKAQFENQSGYSTTEVLEWLKHEIIFYNAAKEEWELTGSLFLDGNLGVDQFIHGEEKLKVVGVLERIKKLSTCDDFDEAWVSYLLPTLKRFYFQCKSNGYIPRYDALQRNEVLHQKEQHEAMLMKKHTSVQQTKDDDIRERERMDKLYFDNFTKRLDHAEMTAIKRRIQKKKKERCDLLEEAKKIEHQWSTFAQIKAIQCKASRKQERKELLEVIERRQYLRQLPNNVVDIEMT